jgi:hypothetical protein
LFQRCKARLKENRDKIVNNLRNLHPHKHVEDLLSTIGKFESDVTCPLWNVGHETKGSDLTAEGNITYL